MSEVLIDLSELVRQRWRTGIQRVERQLLRNWPGPGAFVPVVFDAARCGFTAIADRELLALVEDLDESGKRPHDDEGSPVISVGGKIVFNPEAFYGADRAAWYRALTVREECQVKWLVYDFLPWLQPQFFSPGTSCYGMHYIRALRTVRDVAFASEATRAEYLSAIMRSTTRDGPVFALGGDGLGMPRQRFEPARRTFVVLGQVTARKNVAVVVEAFRNLWRQGIAAPLAVLGGVDTEAVRERALFSELAGSPLFTFVERPSDAAVRAFLGRARALVSASEGEGFGLLPFEALAVGVPVVVTASMPSIRLLPPAGQIRLPQVTPRTVSAAVRRLCDDADAARLWGEAANLTVPTWKDFASGIARWLQE